MFLDLFAIYDARLVVRGWFKCQRNIAVLPRFAIKSVAENANLFVVPTTNFIVTNVRWKGTIVGKQ